MANLVKLASKARSMGSKCESVNQAPEKPTAPNQIDLFWMFCFLGLGLFMVVLICFALYFTRRTETTWWIILHSHPQSQYVAPKYIGAWLEDCRDLVETDKSLITGCTLADNGHFGHLGGFRLYGVVGAKLTCWQHARRERWPRVIGWRCQHIQCGRSMFSLVWGETRLVQMHPFLIFLLLWFPMFKTSVVSSDLPSEQWKAGLQSMRTWMKINSLI